MTTNESSNAPDAGTTPGDSANPYQSPISPALVLAEHAGIEMRRMPEGIFWVVASVALALSILATYLSYGLAAPLVLALVAGIVRVCIITWRRSVRGLATSEIPLLLTSALLSLALMIGCATAFGGICTAVVLAVGQGPSGLLPAVWISTAGGFATFVALFILSIKWAV